MYIGDNLIFIIDSNNRNEFIIYSYILDDSQDFKIIMIMKYRNELFAQIEIDEYISNRKGPEFYFKKRNINYNVVEPKHIFNGDGVEIGEIILFENAQKFFRINENDNINNDNNDDDIKIGNKQILYSSKFTMDQILAAN